jgi:hypothetical protein
MSLPPMPVPISLSVYSDKYIEGYPGDLADIGLKDTISRENSGTTNIPFGAAVTDGPQVGTGEMRGCQLWAGPAGTRVLGFAKSDYALHPQPGTFPNSNPAPGPGPVYLPTDMVQVIRDGRMRQQAPADVNPGDPVFVSATTGLVSPATGNTQVPGCTWETNSKAGEIGIIQIMLP